MAPVVGRFNLSSVNDSLSEVEAAKTHTHSVVRDYISQPRLSKTFYRYQKIRTKRINNLVV